MTTADVEHEVAQTVGAAMMVGDKAAAMLGIALEEVASGYARFRMTVRPDMVNSHDICHGRLIFTLADTAFAVACNSSNHVAVAQHCSITFLTPAKTGDILVAIAQQHNRRGRTGVTDTTVAREDGENIAVFRGNSVALKGEVVPDLTVKT
ncbi:MAG: hydroxyphenylacetyl-CoA thioesterase PaaI [Alphaproteobacteria bacterium]|nr:hydroxyphenylacetyl-CoA thioesterase PaaI [Alphaproteobacteria bacterium]